MTQEVGKQYDKDNRTDTTGFLAKARLHQSKYRAFDLKLPYDSYGNYLTKEDAIKGLNFYDDFEIFSEVKNRYPNYSKPLYANMLRSEHIGFNLFVPFKNDLEYGKKVLNEFLNSQIQSIDKIEIEYAPAPAKKYLNDKTSFDTYIEYTDVQQNKGILGIEVKYTEHEYALKSGSKQEADILNKESRYYQISAKCELFKPDTIELLISDKFRQVWRNQLLGESILIEDSDNYKSFTSITIFPKGNTHFVETSQEYIDMLAKKDNKFIPIEYEDFFSACEKHSPNEHYNKWIKYMRERYIVT